MYRYIVYKTYINRIWCWIYCLVIEPEEICIKLSVIRLVFLVCRLIHILKLAFAYKYNTGLCVYLCNFCASLHINWTGKTQRKWATHGLRRHSPRHEIQFDITWQTTFKVVLMTDVYSLHGMDVTVRWNSTL